MDSYNEIDIDIKQREEVINIKKKIILICYVIFISIIFSGYGCGSYRIVSVFKANPDEVTIDFNETKSIYVLSNDEGDGSLSEFTQGKLGTVTKGKDSGLIYTPNKNVYGKDIFEYTKSKNNSKVTATVTVNINPPQAIEVNDDSISCVEDNSVEIDFILDNDKSVVLGTLEMVDFTNINNGIVEKINGNYFFVPDKDFNGDGGFIYTVKDVMDRIGTGFVNVKVTPAPDSPEAFDDKGQVFNDETIEIDVVKNDIDVDGDNIHVVKVFDYYSNGRNHLGTMKIKDNKIYYTPYKGKVGIDKFKYTIKDDSGLEATGIVTVGVMSRGKTLKKTININEDNNTLFSIEGHSVDIKDYPQSGDIELDRNRVWYIPHENFNGEDFFTFYYRNNNNGTDYMEAKVIVNPVNDAPMAIDDEFLIDVNSSDNVFNVLSNDIDVDGDNLTIKSIGLAKNGVAILKDNKIVYNPAKDFEGQDTFTYTISDGNGETSTAAINITVKPVNHDPIAMDDEFTIQEDTRESVFDVLNNDTDIDNDNLTIEKINTIQYGSALIKNNKLVYYSAKDFYGKDTITYTINDGKSGMSTATIIVIVNPVNDNPVAINDEFVVEEDSIDNIFDVLINDIEKDNDKITITKIYGTVNGSCRVEGNKVIYNPLQNFNGTDTIWYYISDGKGGTHQSHVCITVNPVSDAPIAVDDIYTAEVSSSDNVFDVLVNDTDADGDNIRIESITSSKHGTVRIQNNKVIYNPFKSFVGKDTITYTINDGNGETSTATVRIIVNFSYIPRPIKNKKPVATDDSFEVEANSENNEFDALNNDSDADGDPLTIASVGTPQHGTATIVSNKIKYTPNAEYSGEDTITYTISDGDGGTAKATITINVTAVEVNNNPIATDDVFEVEANSENNEFDVLSNDSDADGDTLTIASVGTPQHGTATIVSNKIKYTPNAEYSGEDTIPYTISDGDGGTATATITINVTAVEVNNNPIATDDSFKVETNSENNEFDVLSNDSDADGDTLTIASVGIPQHGTATIVSNKIKYTPNEEFNDDDTITYTISDGKGGTSTATITINVKVIPVNSNPVATDDSYEVEANSENNEFDVLNNDSDADGDTLTIASVGTPQHGTATIVSNKIKYTPNAEYSGEDTIFYTISDGKGGTATATITINVKVIPVNSNPVATDDSYEVEANSENNEFDVLSNDSDADGDTLTIASVGTPQHGTTTIVSNKIKYTPNAEYSGEDTITYTISDGKGGTAIAQITVTVNSANNVPVAVDDTMNLTNPSEEIGFVLVNDYDDENDPFSIKSFTQGQFGGVRREGNHFYYEPVDDFSGYDTFTYTISDAQDRTSTATVTVMED